MRSGGKKVEGGQLFLPFRHGAWWCWRCRRYDAVGVLAGLAGRSERAMRGAGEYGELCRDGEQPSFGGETQPNRPDRIDSAFFVAVAFWPGHFTAFFGVRRVAAVGRARGAYFAAPASELGDSFSTFFVPPHFCFTATFGCWKGDAPVQGWSLV